MPRTTLFKTALLILSLLGLPVQAGVYTYIDADGNRVFTDQPPHGKVQRIELAPSNSMPRTEAPRAPVSLSMPEPLPRYNLLRILIPEPDATLRDPTGNLIVTANVDPSLLPGHRFRLQLDGAAYGEASNSPVFALTNIDRGTHLISVEIIDASGRIVERTPAQPFHMKRISLAEKRRAHPCKNPDWGVRPECPLADKPATPKRDIPLVPFI